MVSSTREEPSKFDLAKGMAETKRQRQIEALRKVFRETVASTEQEKADIEPTFRQALGQTMTQDTMQRAAQEKIQASQGLSGAGSRTQTDIAQNVITGGQVGALRQQKADLIADINRRINKANVDLQSGIVDANLQAQLEQDQLELARIEEAEAKALEAERVERDQFLSTLGRFSQDYQAEINRVSNDGDPSNDWQIPYLQAARQDKIAGIEAGKAEQEALRDERLFELAKIQDEREYEIAKINLENELERENTVLDAQIQLARDNNNFALESQLLDKKAQNDQTLQTMRTEGALQEIAFRDQLESTKEPETVTGLPERTIINAINNEVDRRVQTAIEGQTAQERELGETAMTTADQRQVALNVIVNNPDWFGNDVNKLQAVASQYGYTLQDIVDYENLIETVIADKPFE